MPDTFVYVAIEFLLPRCEQAGHPPHSLSTLTHTLSYHLVHLFSYMAL